MRIIFARHGESEANIARVSANRSMGHRLTGRGHAQARALADALHASGAQAGPPDRTSVASLPIRGRPLLQAREIADILGRVLGRSVIVDEALREADCGVMDEAVAGFVPFVTGLPARGPVVAPASGATR